MTIGPSSAWNNKGGSATEKVDLSPLREKNRLTTDGHALDIEYLVIKAGSAEHKGLEKLHSHGTIPANTVHLSLDPSDAGRLTVSPEIPFDKSKGGLVIVVDDGAIGLIAQDFSDRAQKNIKAHPDRKDAFYKPLLKGEMLREKDAPLANEAERHQRIGEFVLASGEVGQNLIKTLYPQAENMTLEGEASQTVSQMLGAEVAKRLDPLVGPAAPASGRKLKPSL